MWHASASYASRTGLRPLRLVQLDVRARLELASALHDALLGVGDATLGEWTEDGEVAVHYRRRLTAEEWGDRPWGIDYRGTEEGARRLAAVAHRLPPGWSE